VVKLETTTEPPSPPRPETLQDLMSAPTPKPTRGRDMDEDGNMDVDRKPDLSPSNPHRARDTQGNPTSTTAPTGVKPIYGFEGIPSFPPKWTYPPRPMVSRLISFPIALGSGLTNRRKWWMIPLMDRLRNGHSISSNSQLASAGIFRRNLGLLISRNKERGWRRYDIRREGNVECTVDERCCMKERIYAFVWYRYNTAM
jgi:hypothetical protein